MPEQGIQDLKNTILKMIFDNDVVFRTDKLLPEQLLDQVKEECSRKNNEGEVSEQLIDHCKELQPFKLTNQQKLNPHGKEVMEKVAAEDGLADFIKLWRKNFLDGMKPKYLPRGWRIDHRIYRQFGEHSVF